MIEIIGEKGTAEYSAALSVHSAFESLWPGISTSPITQDNLKIAANVKISGYKISDIDVVVCGLFTRERRFISKKILNDNKGNKVVGKPITLKNIILVIEVKDHSEENVQITGDKISVKYTKNGKTKWKSATDQNIDQVHALHSYIRDLKLDAFVHRCVFMRSLNSIEIAGAIKSDFSGIH